MSLTILGGFLFRQEAGDFFVDKLYYQVLNPKAGAVRLEAEYRKNFQTAENASDLAHRFLAKMVQNSANVEDAKFYANKFSEQLSERAAAYEEMLRITNSQASLDLSNEYKEFFKRRKEADQTDYEAFKVYRDGIESSLAGSLSLYYYLQMRAALFASFMAILDLNDKTPPKEKINSFDVSYGRINGQFIALENLYNKGVYPDDLFEKVKEIQKHSEESNKIVMGILRGDAEEVSSRLELYFKNPEKTEEKPTALEEALFEWSRRSQETYWAKQDEGHKKARDLYKDAYNYAKNYDLDILTVWPNRLPGDFRDGDVN
jgi:hypothetical protein